MRAKSGFRACQIPELPHFGARDAALRMTCDENDPTIFGLEIILFLFNRQGVFSLAIAAANNSETNHDTISRSSLDREKNHPDMR